MAAIDKTADPDFDICYARGDGDAKTFVIKKDGVVVDISSHTYRMSVNTEINPANTTNELFDVLGVFVTDGTNGQIAFTPGATDLNTITAPGVAFYDVSRITPTKKTVLKGLVNFVMDVGKT